MCSKYVQCHHFLGIVIPMWSITSWTKLETVMWKGLDHVLSIYSQKCNNAWDNKTYSRITKRYFLIISGKLYGAFPKLQWHTSRAGESMTLNNNQTVVFRARFLFTKSVKVWNKQFIWPVSVQFMCLNSSNDAFDCQKELQPDAKHWTGADMKAKYCKNSKEVGISQHLLATLALIVVHSIHI